MHQHHHSNRITRTIVVAVAGVAVGLATTYAVASGSEPRPERAPSQQTPVAAWATERQLSGLSPASLTAQDAAPHPAAQVRALADYARDHGLSGLSPASLGPVDD
jgi:hypothetical protein